MSNVQKEIPFKCTNLHKAISLTLPVGTKVLGVDGSDLRQTLYFRVSFDDEEKREELRIFEAYIGQWPYCHHSYGMRDYGYTQVPGSCDDHPCGKEAFYEVHVPLEKRGAYLRVNHIKSL